MVATAIARGVSYLPQIFGWLLAALAGNKVIQTADEMTREKVLGLEPLEKMALKRQAEQQKYEAAANREIADRADRKDLEDRTRAQELAFATMRQGLLKDRLAQHQGMTQARLQVPQMMASREASEKMMLRAQNPFNPIQALLEG